MNNSAPTPPSPASDDPSRFTYEKSLIAIAAKAGKVWVDSAKAIGEATPGSFNDVAKKAGEKLNTALPGAKVLSSGLSVIEKAAELDKQTQEGAVSTVLGAADTSLAAKKLGDDLRTARAAIKGTPPATATGHMDRYVKGVNIAEAIRDGDGTKALQEGLGAILRPEAVAGTAGANVAAELAQKIAKRGHPVVTVAVGITSGIMAKGQFDKGVEATVEWADRQPLLQPIKQGLHTAGEVAGEASNLWQLHAPNSIQTGVKHTGEAIAWSADIAANAVSAGANYAAATVNGAIALAALPIDNTVARARAVRMNENLAEIKENLRSIRDDMTAATNVVVSGLRGSIYDEDRPDTGQETGHKHIQHSMDRASERARQMGVSSFGPCSVEEADHGPKPAPQLTAAKTPNAHRNL